MWKSMSLARRLTLLSGCLVLTGGAGMVVSGQTSETMADPGLPPIPVMPMADSSAESHTVSAAEFIDTSNPFFQDLGINGRRRVPGDPPDSGWRTTPADVQRRIADALSDFVDFCSRFERHLTPQQKEDLAAFLRTL